MGLGLGPSGGRDRWGTRETAQRPAADGHEQPERERVDSGYSYLGRAAEGLQHTDAARTYYRLALAITFKRAGLFNNCDGIDVPLEAASGLARLGQTPANPGAGAAGRCTEDASPSRVNRPKEKLRLRP